MKTDDLIAALAEDSAPRAPFGRIVMAAVAAGIGVAAAAFFLKIGFRADIAAALGSGRFLFKFVVTMALAATAIGAMARAARPGAGLGGWRFALWAAPLLIGAAVIVELMATQQASWGARLVGENSRVCLTVIPLLSIGPLAALLVALRQGAPTRPGLTGALAGLAASGIAATFYAANCTDDSPLFVATWYPIAIAMVALAGGVIGARVLRW